MPNDKNSTENILKSVATLVDAWCERRCLSLLRFILPAYPLSFGLTDDWANLLKALEDVSAFGRNDLEEEETKTVNELIAAVGQIVYRK